MNPCIYVFVRHRNFVAQFWNNQFFDDYACLFKLYKLTNLFDILRCSIKRSSIQIVSCVLSGNITRNMIFQIFTHSFVFLIVGVNLIDNIHGNSDKTKKKPLDFGKADTYFKSQSYQGMVIMNGSGEPISEKKMSAFSVEDHKNGDKYAKLSFQYSTIWLSY